jgi:hypothetical protein
MSSLNDIERAIAGLNLTTKAETDKRILDDSYAALGKATHKPQKMTGNGVWSVIAQRRFAVPAAVAAMILLAFSLFINSRNEAAVNAGKIYIALSRVDNIHISEFRADQTSPDRQIWTSKTLGVKLLKTEFGNQAEYTLWDMKNRTKMEKYLSSNSIQTEPITQMMLAELEKSGAVLADAVPFTDRNDIPKDAQWNRIDDQALSITVPGTKAYELRWIEKSTDSRVVLYRKWRVFAENRTNLPKRIEWYSKTGTEDDYGFEKFVIIVYPNEDEIQEVIRNIFGRQDSPEFIGTPGAQR